MKRFGCNRFFSSSGCASFQQIIELDDNGCYVRNYALLCEQSAIQWLGGVCILLPRNIVPCSDLIGLFHWMKTFDDELQKGCAAYVWHLAPIDSLKLEITPLTKICRLK